MTNFLKLSAFTFLLMLMSICSFAQHEENEITKAVEKDDIETVKRLVTAENINECDGEYTYLSNAIRNNSAKCLEWLLDNGADVNKGCEEKKPPVFLVCKYGNLDLMKKLISKGAKLEEAQYGGWKLLDYAKKYDNKEIIRYLEKQKK